jgi:hypothetical protein
MGLGVACTHRDSSGRRGVLPPNAYNSTEDFLLGAWPAYQLPMYTVCCHGRRSGAGSVLATCQYGAALQRSTGLIQCVIRRSCGHHVTTFCRYSLLPLLSSAVTLLCRYSARVQVSPPQRWCAFACTSCLSRRRYCMHCMHCMHMHISIAPPTTNGRSPLNLVSICSGNFRGRVPISGGWVRWWVGLRQVLCLMLGCMSTRRRGSRGQACHPPNHSAASYGLLCTAI